MPFWLMRLGSIFGHTGPGAHFRQAVALAKQHKPDIAVLDISMPELNGLEATRQITKALLSLGACVGEGQGFFFRKSGGTRMADWLQTGSIAPGRRVRGSNSNLMRVESVPAH